MSSTNTLWRCFYKQAIYFRSAVWQVLFPETKIHATPLHIEEQPFPAVQKRLTDTARHLQNFACFLPGTKLQGRRGERTQSPGQKGEWCYQCWASKPVGLSTRAWRMSDRETMPSMLACSSTTTNRCTWNKRGELVNKWLSQCVAHRTSTWVTNSPQLWLFCSRWSPWFPFCCTWRRLQSTVSDASEPVSLCCPGCCMSSQQPSSTQKH